MAHKGKIAIVTAATEGIGYAIARRLAAEGAHVILSSRKQVRIHDKNEAGFEQQGQRYLPFSAIKLQALTKALHYRQMWIEQSRRSPRKA